MKASRIVLCALLALVPASNALAQRGVSSIDLTELSLEDLLNTRITSVGFKEQLVGETAAAVYLLTQDEIRRSGVRTLAELFRLVPAMHVARANSASWAMGVRGFSDVYADKLLVLIDGRSVYNRNFSGVFWDMEDMLVDDIDHIEVIAGAGGAEWGANAVSGVINIITKSSEETKGALVRVGAGTFDPSQLALRYGGSLGDASFRVSSQWSHHGASRIDRETSAHDSWASIGTTGRIDWTRGVKALMLQGGFISTEPRPMWMQLSGPIGSNAPSRIASDRSNASVLGRWTHRDADGGSLRLQSSFTRLYMAEVSTTESERIGDLEAQYRRSFGRHDVVFGGGYRWTRSALSKPTFSYSVTPALSTVAVTNAFAQDEIRLTKRLAATFGAKVESATLSGWSVLPTARAVWTIAPSQHLWAAVSKAVRTPSGSDRGIDLKFAAFPGANGQPVVMGIIGNPDLRPESVTDRQVGYRIHVGSSVAMDVSVFRGDYSRLLTAEPATPTLRASDGIEYLFVANRYENLLDATTSGVELSGRWTVTDSWLLKGSYSGFRATPHVSPLSRDTSAAANLRDTPAHQWQLHSTTHLGERAEVTIGLFGVGSLVSLNVPAHTRADATLEIRASRDLSVVVSGRDLLEGAHAEFPSWSTGMRMTSVPRSASVQLVWRR